jgi:hypothetical protein
MSELLKTHFDGVTMVPYFRLEYLPRKNFELEKYFRLEVVPKPMDDDDDEFEEYFRLEINEEGELEEVIGLDFSAYEDDESDYEFDEVVGLNLRRLPDTFELEETVGLEIFEDEDDYDLCDLVIL